ncbi:MAG: HU family DNA-binding protein [Patescibacteria group bacterium]|nr:HU family DNA-binding protein [Patescibacteria group bacterium]
MDKETIIDELAKRTGFMKKDMARALDELTSIMQDTLVKGDRVCIGPLGVFKVVQAKARVSRNLKTGEPVQVPARRRVKFYLSESTRRLL